MQLVYERANEIQLVGNAATIVLDRKECRRQGNGIIPVSVKSSSLSAKSLEPVWGWSSSSSSTSSSWTMVREVWWVRGWVASK